jgi:multidrug efflux pump subunit AcrA (membrane-fusion protein)
MSRRVWIGLLILVLAVGAYVGYNRLNTSEATPQEQPTQTEEPEPVVWASGKVLPARRADLSLDVAGRLVELAVSEGDRVEIGDLIASLDTTLLSQQVNEAEAALAIARAQRDQLRAGARTEDIEAAREAVAAAEAGLGSIQAQLARVAAGPTQYELDLAKVAIDSARDALYAAQAQRDAAGYLRDDERIGAAEYEAANAAVLQAEGAVRQAELRYEQLQAGATSQERAEAAAGVAAARAAKAAAEAQVTALQSQAAAAEAGVDQARLRHQALQTGPTAEDIALAEAQVFQAEAALEAAQVAVKQATLASPFAGTIGQVYFDVGEVVTPGQPIVTLGDLSRIRIETTDLRETDVARVEVGQSVDVTFDSLPNVRLDGTVTHVAPMATQGQGGTNYTVWVEPAEIDPRLRWGMTAYVNIEVE